MVKRYLVKLIVQPIWVEIDEDDNATELVSQPEPVPAHEVARYAAELMAYAERAKRGEIDAQQA